MIGENSSLLAARNIYKRFGATEALSGVDLALWPGEIHCLVGENGAGKSTLAKIITGIEQPDRGSIELEGKETTIRDVSAARELGIAAVSQHPIIFPDLSVSENIFAGRPPRSGPHWLPMVDRYEMERQAADIFSQMGVAIDPRALAASLSVGDQQLLEIAKALLIGARILVLDEPTASLSDRDVEALFSIIRRLVAEGVSVLFISHRLDEVFALGERVTVLRDARRVGTRSLSDVDRDKLIEMMVGRPLDVLYQKQESSIGREALRVEGWSREGVFADVSFSVRAGEIVGMAGLIGAGRTEVARSLFGAERHDRGAMWLQGRRVAPQSPAQMLQHGLAYVPEDRHREGLILSWPVFANLTLPALRRFARGGMFLAPASERETASEFVARLSVRPPDVDRPVQKLSGGNQQKVLLAKWLAAEPAVLILDEPTRGIDVGAKVEVHRAISELAAQGIGILLISSELPELLGMSDRILVLCEGRIVGAFSRSEATQEKIMRAATDFHASINHKLAHGAAGVHEP